MTRLLASLALLLCTAGALAAQDIPGLYRVTGVAADDTLNVREGPGTDFAVIEELAPTAAGIEVTALDPATGWGRINTGERAGWVSMAFLAAQSLATVDGVPRPLSCYGTEPFWSLDLAADGSATFDRFGERVASLDRVEPARAANLLGRSGVVARTPAADLSAILATRDCSDGMSDRLFGYAVDMILDTGEGPEVLSGCCSLSAD